MHGPVTRVAADRERAASERAEAAEAALKSERESHKRTQELLAAMQTAAVAAATDDDTATAAAATATRGISGDDSTPIRTRNQQHRHHHQQKLCAGGTLTPQSSGGGNCSGNGGSSIPRAVVEQIRREKMVLPSAGHGEGQFKHDGRAAVATDDPALRSLQQTLGRALHKLSQDLYQLLLALRHAASSTD